MLRISQQINSAWHYCREKIQERHLQHQLDRQLTEVIRHLITAVRSGQSLSMAMQRAAEFSPSPFADLLHQTLIQQRLGRSFQETLQEWLVKSPSEEMELLVQVLLFSDESGGKIAEALRRVEQLTVRKKQLREKISALTAQGRLQGKTMCLFPWLMLLAIYLLDHDYLAPLLQEKSGYLILALMLTSNLLGLLWIRKLTRFSI
jgi:tight adherence protein B